MNRLIAAVTCLAAAAAFAPAAETPTAHSPQFENRKYWPQDVEKTAYYRQKWPSAPLFVWARPEPGRYSVELRDPKNWLVDGKPATRIPDKNTDVIFPDGKYSIKFSRDGILRVRHMTIGAGAQVSVHSVDVDGNLWIRQGGSLKGSNQRFGGPDKDNFCRSDNDKPQFITNMFTLNKQKDKSTEWVGKWQVGDEVTMTSGRFIVGPGSTFLVTDRRSQTVQADAKLILLSGSTFEMRGNFYEDVDILVDGELLAGTADRPLTKSCTVGLSFKDAKGGKKGKLNIGLVVTADGQIAVHSADPAKARLIFDWHRRKRQSPGRHQEGESDELARQPHGIKMLLIGRARLDGVEFDDVLKGGIMMPDPATRSTWKHVVFGKNFGKPEELFAAWQGESPRVKSGMVGRSAIERQSRGQE